jgi:hypothetical protein
VVAVERAADHHADQQGGEHHREDHARPDAQAGGEARRGPTVVVVDLVDLVDLVDVVDVVDPDLGLLDLVEVDGRGRVTW